MKFNSKNIYSDQCWNNPGIIGIMELWNYGKIVELGIMELWNYRKIVELGIMESKEKGGIRNN